jgi:2,4-dienoyl-CoA reductase-like NADH-dependent reductase (Old Yellow Enzyme family)
MAHASALRDTAASLQENSGAVPGIQIGHAGRKASANRPWEGDDHMKEDDPRAWETLSPSPIAYGGGLWKVPREMTLDGIARVQADFVAGARRALAAGFRWLELHFAHGYLAQSFFSVHANRRSDGYGGDALRRGRFLLETVAAVRAVWPENLPLATAWGMEGPADAERAVASGQMDLVMIARAHLADPHYAYTLARALNADRPEWATLPAPYAHWLQRYQRPSRAEPGPG